MLLYCNNPPAFEQCHFFFSQLLFKIKRMLRNAGVLTSYKSLRCVMMNLLSIVTRVAAEVSRENGHPG